MKGRWESNITVWFRFMYIPRNETARPHYFQNIIIMFCLPMFTFMYLWAIYIFPGPVCLLGCSKIGRWSCDPVPLRSWASDSGVREHNPPSLPSHNLVLLKDTPWFERPTITLVARFFGGEGQFEYMGCDSTDLRLEQPPNWHFDQGSMFCTVLEA